MIWIWRELAGRLIYLEFVDRIISFELVDHLDWTGWSLDCDTVDPEVCRRVWTFKWRSQTIVRLFHCTTNVSRRNAIWQRVALTVKSQDDHHCEQLLSKCRLLRQMVQFRPNCQTDQWVDSRPLFCLIFLDRPQYIRPWEQFFIWHFGIGKYLFDFGYSHSLCFMKLFMQSNKTFFIVHSGKKRIFAWNEAKDPISDVDFLKNTFAVSPGETWGMSRE
jgi:hypothetical protein